jgi:hypothetical protein
MIITTKDSTAPFTNFISLGSDGANFVYHVISTKPIDDADLNPVFNGKFSSRDYVTDFAYPVLSPVTKFQPICLEKNFFYLNGIESAASSMEASVLSARNAVMLLKEQQKS